MATKERINNMVNKLLNEGNEVNYISIINDIDNYHKISISANYIEPKSCFYYSSDGPKRMSNYNDYYYGLSPKFSDEKISEMIKSEVLVDESALNQFLNENGHLFMLDNENLMKNYGKELFVKVILQVSLHYGFIIEVPESFKLNLNLDNIYIKDNHMIIVGRPSNELLNSLPYKISKDLKLVLNDCEEAYSLKDLYYNDNFKLSLLDKNYYSGVLPRLKRINKVKAVNNINVKSYSFEISRTTFATVEGFDKANAFNFKIIKPYLEKLNEFYLKEYELENKYLTVNTNIENINEYLFNTHNTNIIAVSSNIITSDNYLFYGLRNNNSYDSNTIYCSVNGQSEIFDKMCISANPGHPSRRL